MPKEKYIKKSTEAQTYNQIKKPANPHIHNTQYIYI